MTKYQYKFKKEKSNLVVIIFIVIGIIAYGHGSPNFNPPVVNQLINSLYVAFIVFLTLIACFISWINFKTEGRDYSIAINHESVTFPNIGNHLKVTTVHFSSISEIYYEIIEGDSPDILFIKYDNGSKRVFVAKANFTSNEFDDICNKLMIALGQSKIEIKKT
ncbi:MAG: hypothetical protein COB34_02355 [Methylophilaceae bacterium]|nr:MAG: hypothetical protein COB34_02355 [Methylophilaceae bacterium]